MPANRTLPALLALLMILQPLPTTGADEESREAAPRSSWSDPIQLTNSTNSSWDPSIYVDGSGNIHLAWQDGTDRTSIRYKSFAPSGEVIVNDTVLVNYYDPQPPVYVSGRPFAPRLDCNNGSLVLFWNSTENHPSGQTDHDENLRMLRFSPDLKSRRDCWLPVYAIDRLYYGNPLYAFDSKGNIHFAYAGNSEWYGEPSVWYVKTNSTGGKLFSKFLVKNETEVGVAVDKWDNVHLVWRNETGNLTYSRLDQNGTELCKTEQIPGINHSIRNFTIVAKQNNPGANIYWNEMDIYMCSISPNGTSRTVYLHNGQGQAQSFHYNSRYPLVARADARGLNYIFGYCYIQRQGGHTFPYDIIMGMTDEEGTRQLYCEAVEGMDLVDHGYTEVGPPFSACAIARGSSGSYVNVAYSNDRQTWEGPAGGINIYLDIRGPYANDLYVHGLQFSKRSPLEQDDVTISVAVAFYQSYPPVDLPVDFDVELFIDGVSVNSSHGTTYKVGGVDFNWTATKGLHDFMARVTSGISELNQSNNEMNASLYVYGRPDISVEDIVWDPPSPVVGDRVNISARIGNEGETAGTFNWGIELNGSVLTTDTARLGPGERGNLSTEWRPALPGNYTFLALASGTVPYELELWNNSLERTIQVSPAQFSVEILSPADGSVVLGVVNITGHVNGMWGEPVLRLALGNGTPMVVPLFPDGGWSWGWNTLDMPNGRCNITASAGNGWVESKATVQVVVHNPVPEAVFRPAGGIVINESEEAAFESEILWGLSLSAGFNWTVNGRAVGVNYTKWANIALWANTTRSSGGILSRLIIRTNWTSAGNYTVEVVVGHFYFEQVRASFSWNLTVRNVNTPPVIWRFSLPENLTARQNDRLNFWVEATDPEGDALNYDWFVDGKRCGTAPSSPGFNLTALGRAGSMNITLSVSDGEFRASRTWAVTVLSKKETVTTEPVRWPWAAAMVLCAAAAISLWAVYQRRKPPKTA